MRLLHANRLVLDTGVLGQIVHPRKYDATREWLATVIEDVFDTLGVESRAISDLEESR